MHAGQLYFWTATINSWQRLLWSDRYKDVIVDSLNFLSESGRIEVFGFVIMPTHIHFIWKMLDFMAKETAWVSFLKYTAHTFRKMLIENGEPELIPYKVATTNKKHEFWQPNSLAVPVNTRKKAFQKLEYIHDNPIKDYWRLARDPSDYFYSSASYYERNETHFSFLKNLGDEF
jgi:REP element-mobilizing transposase RayT